MLEKVYTYTTKAAAVFENVITQENMVVNHVIIEPGQFFPKHPTDSHVVIIIVSGALSLTLEDQATNVYHKGQVVEVDQGLESVLGNGSEELTEVFVIKR